MANRCRALTTAELRRAAAAVPSVFRADVALRNLCLLRLRRATGLRISAALSLTLGDVVDRDTGGIVETLSVAARFSKGRTKIEQIALSPAAIDALRPHLPAGLYDPQRHELCLRLRAARKRVHGRQAPLQPAARAALAEWVEEMRRRGWVRPEVPLFLSTARARGGLLRAISRGQAWRIMQGLKAALGLRGVIGTHSLRKAWVQGLLSYFQRTFPGEAARNLERVRQATGHRTMEAMLEYAGIGREEVERGLREA